jgi:putative oxidoreductase
MYDKIWRVIKHPATLTTLKVFLGLIFILSSVTKVGTPEKFGESIAAYRLIPEMFIPVLSMLIPWLQLICGVLLITDMYVQSSAMIISGLLVVYTVAIAQAWARGIEIPCGCFDLDIGLEDEVGGTSVMRDLTFLLFSTTLIFFDKNKANLYGLIAKFKK